MGKSSMQAKDIEKIHKSAYLNSSGMERVEVFCDADSSMLDSRGLLKLLQVFDYIKRYHADIFEALALMLQLLILRFERAERLCEMVALHGRRKDLSALYTDTMRDLFGEAHTKALPKLNLGKILKTITATSINLELIEQFIHIITIKRTLNKLYIYATPKEVNDLIVSLLDVRENEEVYNPCYGMGTLFPSLARHFGTISLFGEELDERLANVAKLMARISGVDCKNLCVNDILKKPVFKSDKGFRQFDKILCNPPFSAHIGIEYLKNDERFSRYGILAKSSPELIFLTHALMHLRKKGVFIVRNQTLQKSFLEEKLRERMVEERVIEAIIELPKNIFPHQSHDFSILVLSAHSDTILHIDATSERFFQKDGKYNRLSGVDEILSLYREKRESQYSKLTSVDSLDIHDLRAQSYLRHSLPSATKSISLGALNPLIFRGQRVYGSAHDEDISYLDVGIQDFAMYHFTELCGAMRYSGESKKIERYKLRPYDILLPLRGNSSKVTILGESYRENIAVANTGIVIIRLNDELNAQALYLYLFSHAGQKQLSILYEANTLSPEALNGLAIPRDFTVGARERFEKLRALSDSLNRTIGEIEELR